MDMKVTIKTGIIESREGIGLPLEQSVVTKTASLEDEGKRDG